MKKDGLFQLTWSWLSLENLIILYYIASIQICPSQEYECFSAFLQGKVYNFEEWYANANDILAFFCFSNLPPKERSYTFLLYYF